jgi:hypothetical protein
MMGICYGQTRNAFRSADARDSEITELRVRLLINVYDTIHMALK